VIKRGIKEAQVVYDRHGPSASPWMVALRSINGLELNSI